MILSYKAMRRRREIGVAYLFALPGLLLLAVFMFYPLVYSLWLSFTEYNFAYSEAPKFVGMQNYLLMWQDEVFRSAVLNTVKFAVAYFPLAMTLPLLIALLLNQRLPGFGILRVSVFLPVIVAFSLIGVVFQWILNGQFGVLNRLLVLAGLHGLTRDWLASPDTALWSLVAVSLWKDMGFQATIYLAGLQSISPSILEAARIDGASDWKVFTRVTLPNLKETFLLTAILGVIESLKVYTQPAVMTQGGPQNATLTVYLHVWNTAFKHLDMGLASAMSYTLGLVVVAFAILNFKLFKTERQ